MECNFDLFIDRTDSESIKWRRYGPDVLPLWVADMDFTSPEPVVRALAERVKHGVFGYAQEPPALRPLLVERLQSHFGWSVAPEEFVFLPGVINGFNLVAHAVTTPGDGMLLQTPAYPPMLMAPTNAGLTRDEVELGREPSGRYRIDFDALERAITPRTRMFLLCNPHNPVGRVYEPWELQRMAEICLRHDVFICSDEIHGDLIFSGHKHTPIAALSPEIAQRSVTLMAPSKTFNLPGLHFSFAVVPDPGVRERMQASRRGLVGSVGVMGYTAALAAYGQGGPWLDELLPYLQDNRDYLADYVTTLLPGISMCAPEGTYLAWLDCHNAGIPGVPCQFFLEKARVGLQDGANFGRGGEGFVRLNFGCCRSTLTEALERMRAALANLRA